MQTRPEIYLDNGATTRPDPEVMAALVDRQANLFANPASRHRLGRAAAAAHETARARLAALIGGDAKHLIFTGGGTEALGLALLGTPGGPGHIALSAVEHSSVAKAARRLVQTRGWTTDGVPVDRVGRVTPEALAARIGPETRIVAVMLAQNEVGTVNDIAPLAAVVRRRAPRARLVVDAVQALGKIPIDVAALDVDCLAVTAHKLHGPRGIGALWSRAPIEPVLEGGGQEGGRRGGTQSAPLALAFADAAERALAQREHLATTRDRLWRAIRGALPDVRLTGLPCGPARLPHNLHLCVPGLRSEPLLNQLDALGVCASAGSACRRGAFSSTLAALGHRAEDGAWIRLTTGRFTTLAEVDAAAERFVDAVGRLRRLMGGGG